MFKSRRRQTAVPCEMHIERLENREQLTVSTVFAAATLTTPATLTIVGDEAANNISVIDRGGNMTVIGDGVSKRFTGVTAVVVISKGGDDTVSYQIAASSLRVNRVIDINLGAGNDTLGMSNTGLSGIDYTEVVKSLKIKVHAGGGDDTVSNSFDFLIQEEGLLRLNVRGGDGVDNLSTNISIDADSVGVLDVAVDGGAGADVLSLFINSIQDDLLFRRAILEGGSSANGNRATISNPSLSPFPVTVRNCGQVFFG